MFREDFYELGFERYRLNNKFQFVCLLTYNEIIYCSSIVYALDLKFYLLVMGLDFKNQNVLLLL